MPYTSYRKKLQYNSWLWQGNFWDPMHVRRGIFHTPMGIGHFSIRSIFQFYGVTKSSRTTLRIQISQKDRIYLYFLIPNQIASDDLLVMNDYSLCEIAATRFD